MPRGGTGTSLPVALKVLMGLVGVEVVVLVAAAVVLGIELVGGRSLSVGVSAFLLVFVLGVAAVLVSALRALSRGRRWARSPIATWQILQVVVSVSSLGAGVAPGAIAALVVAVGVFVLLMVPTVVAVTTGRATE